jgi:signal transduction histidine kinase/CheY-like chemotaxis protein
MSIIEEREMRSKFEIRKFKELGARRSSKEGRLHLHSDFNVTDDPDEGIENLELPDIIDIEALQSLMESFQQLTGMVFAILDLKGTILVSAGWQDICTKFHRVHCETSKQCTESDVELTRGVAPGQFKLYRCKNQMWDVSTPLFIGGKHMGNLFMGQFLFTEEEPDRAFFRNQAKKFGFDEKEYLAALDRVPRWSHATLDTVMHFYSQLADMIAKLSYGNIKLARAMAEKNELIAQLEESKRMAELANASKSQFLANMSHEIRTPLNGVLGMLHLIKDGGVTDELEMYADMAIRSGVRLTNLLGDILDLSRIEAGRMPIVREPFAMRDIITPLAETFSPLHYSNRLSLDIDVFPGVPSRLIGDEIRLRQILFNLIGNGMKFTEQGVVRLEISPLLPDPRGMARLLFIISDTGKGIPENKIDHICQPFIQAEGDFTRSHQGAGLGLSITNELVNAMGGTMTFDSTEGQGTRVYLMLPFSLAPEFEDPLEPRMDRDVAPSISKRLLVVEDDEVNRLSARLNLEKMGYQVATANHGDEALEALRGGSYDCVLMDIQMDVMDGVEATRRIRSGNHGVLDSDIPIVAMTAYAMTGDRDKFLAAGMNEYVAKPVQMDDLKVVLEHVMGQARAERDEFGTP